MIHGPKLAWMTVKVTPQGPAKERTVQTNDPTRLDFGQKTDLGFSQKTIESNSKSHRSDPNNCSRNNVLLLSDKSLFSTSYVGKQRY